MKVSQTHFLTPKQYHGGVDLLWAALPADTKLGDDDTVFTLAAAAIKRGQSTSGQSTSGQSTSDPRDSFGCTPQQYHHGLDLLWAALPVYKAEGIDDVFSIAAKTIECGRGLEAENKQLKEENERLRRVLQPFAEVGQMLVGTNWPLACRLRIDARENDRSEYMSYHGHPDDHLGLLPYLGDWLDAHFVHKRKA